MSAMFVDRPMFRLFDFDQVIEPVDELDERYIAFAQIAEQMRRAAQRWREQEDDK